MSALELVRHEQILEITLNRPKANAIDAATSREMGQVFADFHHDPRLRVAILTGAGARFFSAGWDLNAAALGEAFDSDYGVGGFAGLSELHVLNKPVIAAINGMAVGGGFELALCCDLIVAADHAELWLPEVFVGIIPDAAAIRLPKRLPHHIAMEMLLTGRRMQAQEALQWGLVNAVVPAATVLDRARVYAQAIVQAAPLAVRAIKDISRSSEGLNDQESYAVMRDLDSYQRMLASEDAREGPRAFAEKRDPIWKDR
jgi:crotonobetainyl-CoA hydratase